MQRKHKFIMAKNIPITYKGVRYPSLAALARQFGVDPAAFCKKRKKVGMKNACEYYREKTAVPSIKEMAKTFGIPKNTLYYISRRKGLQKTYEYCKKKQENRIVWNSVTYRSISALARHFEVDRSIFTRKTKKLSFNEACKYYEDKLQHKKNKEHNTAQG